MPYNEPESVNLNDIEVKVPSFLSVDNSKNVFLNEQLILFPLYKPIKYDKETKAYLFFPSNDFRLELYCNACKKRRIFAFANSDLDGISIYETLSVEKVLLKHKVDYFNIIALADCGHELFMMFKVIDDKNLLKIGQYSSIYDMNEEINNKKFLKLLGKEYEGYYKTACSLYSFNSCIGAITYLRRIFEKILIDTFNDHSDKLGHNFVDFQKLRMEEKIKQLHDYLPDIIMTDGFNKIYSKISDGIHNLNEDECSKIFPTLKAGIEEILIEKLSDMEKEERQKELATKLNHL